VSPVAKVARRNVAPTTGSGQYQAV